MSMRLLIGISLAFLVTSPCAIGKTPEKSASHHRGEAGGFPDGAGETPIDKSGSFLQAVCGGNPDPCCTSFRTTGMRLFGKAAWYNLVGRHTATGEILNTVTATAAHRSLPLNSLARVTNLKNGRSIIVIVNDRGPMSPSLIIDLSPDAAEALDMMRDGVVPVAVEPVALQTAEAR